MFEFDKYEERFDREPPSEPVGSYETARDVERLSFLVWGEHCVECAAPACFSSCDLYEPRPDRRCRRFVFGTMRNRHFSTLRGHGAELVFKKWAKLEARGNTLMEPTRQVLGRERRIRTVLPLLNAVGKLVYRVTGDLRWSHVSHSWLGTKGPPPAPKTPPFSSTRCLPAGSSQPRVESCAFSACHERGQEGSGGGPSPAAAVFPPPSPFRRACLATWWRPCGSRP